ncbi:hypothetical protein PUNSTDRAFT_146557, partial [Punctularia strigosozonata HHB-11173 SS5]
MDGPPVSKRRKIATDLGSKSTTRNKGNPNKSQKDPAKIHFSTGKQVITALAQREALADTLQSIRNQLSLDPEESVGPQDPRFLLAKDWIDSDFGAESLFRIWDAIDQRQTGILPVLLGTFSALLILLSKHYTYHADGLPIVRRLLSQSAKTFASSRGRSGHDQSYMDRLAGYIAGNQSQPHVILAVLKLWNVLMDFAAGQERLAAVEAFPWDGKFLPRLLKMRRRSKGGGKVSQPAETSRMPDIRSLMLNLVLGAISPESSPAVKSVFLERHPGVLALAFGDIASDDYSTIQRALETSWSLWTDMKVRRGLKVAAFGEKAITNIIKLYDRYIPEGAYEEEIPADLVHHFLLALCTHPGQGLCYKDRGWYRRTLVDDEDEARGVDTSVPGGGGAIYNKILGNVLKRLNVNEDPRQQELALRIMEACPELVAGYWSAANLTLEPRLSTKWLANIAFFGSVLSLPVPKDCFMLDNHSQYTTASETESAFKPIPPPLYCILQSLLPSTPNLNTKNVFTKGLQSASALVQHCTALALAKCLIKYHALMAELDRVESVLGEGEGSSVTRDDKAYEVPSGQWSRRRQEVEREVRKRVPEFQVIVAFAQKADREVPHVPAQESAAGVAPATSHEPKSASSARAGLLGESALRLLWLYHVCLPSLVAEGRFDVGKLLTTVPADHGREVGEEECPSYEQGLSALRRLHALRLLRESEQFSWQSRSGTHTGLSILLRESISTSIPAIRATIRAILHRAFSDSSLFVHNADEIDAWLDALPMTRRPPHAHAPDGTPLADEGAGVATFLDDCVQRCIRSPYLYIEMLATLQDSSKLTDQQVINVQRSNLPASPLLMTAIEQLCAKTAKTLISMSDTLAVVSFIRHLLLFLACHASDLQFIQACADEMSRVVTMPNSSIICLALRKEIRLARDLVHQISRPNNPGKHMGGGNDVAVREFINKARLRPIPTSHVHRRQVAYELIDELRFSDLSLRDEDVIQIVTLVDRLYGPAIRDLFRFLDPSRTAAFIPAFLDLGPAVIRHAADFHVLFLHSGHEELASPDYRCLLSDVLYAGEHARRLSRVTNALRLVEHRLAKADCSDLRRSLLILIQTICASARLAMDGSYGRLMQYVFGEMRALRTLLYEHNDDRVQEALSSIVGLLLLSAESQTLDLAVPFIEYWIGVMRRKAVDLNRTIRATSIWVPVMSMVDLTDFLDALAAREQDDCTVIQTSLAAVSTRHIDAQHAPRVIQSLAILYRRMPCLEPLGDFVKRILGSLLPIGFDGSKLASAADDATDLADLCLVAQTVWSQRCTILGEVLDIRDLLSASHWSSSAVEIIRLLLYQSHNAREQFSSCLTNHELRTRPPLQLARILPAYLDVAVGQLPEVTDLAKGEWVDLFVRLLSALCDAEPAPEQRKDVRHSVIGILDFMGPQSVLLKPLQQILETPTPGLDVLDLSLLARHSVRWPACEMDQLKQLLVDKALEAAVQHFTSDHDEVLPDLAESITLELATLVQELPDVKTRHVEDLMACIIRHRLFDPRATGLARQVLSKTSLKPVVINRYLQSILQHPDFLKLAASELHNHGIIDIICALFHLHPSNTCQPSHIQPLVSLYRGTVTTTDFQLLSIFRMFEAERRVSVSSLLAQWSPTIGVKSRSAADALCSLKPSRVFRTCMQFPMWRRCRDTSQTELRNDTQSPSVYDPVFVLSLCSRALNEESLYNSVPALVGLFRTNIVSLLVRALSAEDPDLRSNALDQISGINMLLQTADMREKAEVTWILCRLRSLVIRGAVEESPPRLPSYISLFLAHALRAIFYPSTFIFPHTARFLLQRPSLDAADVPMLYAMLFSADEEWRRERAWILRFLSSLGSNREDWDIFDRRRTWELLGSIMQSRTSDIATRNAVIEVLATLTCNQHATSYLIRRRALLSWMSMQTSYLSADERLSWIKLVTNIVRTGRLSALPAATRRQFFEIILGTVTVVLHASNGSPAALHLCARVISIALTCSDIGTMHLHGTMDAMLRCLHKLEKHIPSMKCEANPPYIIDRTSTNNLYDATCIHQPSFELDA